MTTTNTKYIYIWGGPAKTGTEIQTGRKKECGTAKEEVEGPAPL
jgi:hypothetical protein